MSDQEQFEMSEQRQSSEATFIDKFHKDKSRIQNRPRSIIWKILMIGLLILLLLIPLGMVQSIISDRQASKDQVVNEIAQTWAGEQNLLGPILAIPYKHLTCHEDDKGNKKQTVIIKNLYLLPKQYDLKGNLRPEIRYRGIYQSIVYGSQLNINGSFDTQLIQEKGISKDAILWSKAFLVFGISSTNGISKRPGLLWNNKLQELLPGVNGVSYIDSGLFAPVSISENPANIPFSISLSLKGSQSISFIPVGKQNTLFLSSKWNTPSFIGSTLPNSRKVDGEGFTATWEIPYFARSYPQVFTDDDTYSITTYTTNNNDTPVSSSSLKQHLTNSSVGVQLLTPVDSYRQSERAVKYGILFLVLTFATYFLCEVIAKHRLHPFQYMLVGLAISLFYLLLIAFSEVIPFAYAYLIASIAIIAVISLYSKAILGKLKKHAQYIIGGLLSVLYTYLYVLLQLEDLSLLFGSIGLLIVLTIIMYVTRNIDWYNEQST